MKKRILHVLNWDKYQARTDKDLPWCKLWGTLFDRPWFQLLPDSGKLLTIVLLDLARKTGNRIAEEYLFIEYLKGNYGILRDFKTNKEVFILCKLLSDNDFLSDNASDIQDKIREDKTRQEEVREIISEEFEKSPIKTSLYPSEAECVAFFTAEGMPSEGVNFWTFYEMRGWVQGPSKIPIKKWQMAARRWMKQNRNETQDPYKNVPRQIL